MTHKRQFSGVTKPRTFYDRKVSHYGYSRSVSMGHIIPKDWLYVRCTPLKISDTIIVVEFKLLWREQKNAQIKTTHKASRQNT